MSKIAIISDIHGNLPALEATIKVLEERNPDQWVCLGDIVGYGPNSNECLEIVIDMDIPTVLGNHDAGVVDRLSFKHFRNPNRRLLQLTKESLVNTHKKWLSNRPLIIEGNNWIAAHASPINPDSWIYLESAIHIRKMLDGIDKQFCLVGHTHKPSFVPNQLGVRAISSDYKYLLNPGSVGQSRDEDYRASCALLDLDKNVYEIIRVDYEVGSNIANLLKLGFTMREANNLMRII